MDRKLLSNVADNQVRLHRHMYSLQVMMHLISPVRRFISMVEIIFQVKKVIILKRKGQLCPFRFNFGFALTCELFKTCEVVFHFIHNFLSSLIGKIILRLRDDLLLKCTFHICLIYQFIASIRQYKYIKIEITGSCLTHFYNILFINIEVIL
ncbi:hypothetical protein MCCL_0424 [Macrococcoides caseolyticum JCSC5402]|uniref:Uncharacterized protein n=1 Tax=Macrococcus caseolyticus (strain JCSC5402) TaxID=458233 RepID=B9EA70_MACCJ|nr:hypothetical protein MCCL_0424 [Macrococcus caseolyticus JCSC5402]